VLDVVAHHRLRGVRRVRTESPRSGKHDGRGQQQRSRLHGSMLPGGANPSPDDDDDDDGGCGAAARTSACSASSSAARSSKRAWASPLLVRVVPANGRARTLFFQFKTLNRTSRYSGAYTL